jgi:hypothetical protein
MKTPVYAFVEIDTGIQDRYGTLKVTGYVTKSILKSNTRRNKRVRVIGHEKTYYPRRKQIITIIPISS